MPLQPAAAKATTAIIDRAFTIARIVSKSEVEQAIYQRRDAHFCALSRTRPRKTDCIMVAASVIGGLRRGSRRCRHLGAMGVDEAARDDVSTGTISVSGA
jgi:hypothetical protein